MACNLVRGAPNACLLEAYSTAQSSAAWPIPNACEAIPILPASAHIKIVHYCIYISEPNILILISND